MGFAAAAARLPAERFYLPRAVQDELHTPWTPDDTLRLLDPIARAQGARKPARREAPKVGRNDPCPCGSGQKHKRCCAKA
jgi:preprotein translocase subunit SecA